MCHPWLGRSFRPAFASLSISILVCAAATAQDVTRRVSLDSAGAEASGDSTSPSLSYDGRRAVFTSYATDLVPGDTNHAPDVFVRDLVIGTTTRLSVSNSGAEGNSNSSDSVISGDGRFVAFASLSTNLVAGDTNGSWDVFVRDLASQTTTRASVDANGNQANGSSFLPVVSANGRYV